MWMKSVTIDGTAQSLGWCGVRITMDATPKSLCDRGPLGFLLRLPPYMPVSVALDSGGGGLADVVRTRNNSASRTK